MRAAAALVGKECRQVRWFLIVGLGFFVGFPLLEAFYMYSRGSGFRTVDVAEGLVSVLGALFGIIVAVGLVCGELERRLEVFWRSRPVALWKWLASKYIVGLGCVLIVTITPLVMQIVLNKNTPSPYSDDVLYVNRLAWVILMYHSYTLVLIYSVSFLISCAVRKSTQAAILSLGAALLVYFLPVLLPSLEEVSILNKFLNLHGKQCRFEVVKYEKELGDLSWIGVVKDYKRPYERRFQKWWFRLGGGRILYMYCLRSYWNFAGFMLAGSMAACVGAWAAMKRDIRIRMGQKLLFWCLAGVFLLMYCTVAFSLGSNLECEERYLIKHKNEWKDVYFSKSYIEGNSGLLFYSRYDPDKRQHLTTTLIEYELGGGGGFEKNKYSLEDFGLSFSHGKSIAWSKDVPDIVWLLNFEKEMIDDENIKVTLSLVTLKLDSESEKCVLLNEIKLAEYVSEKNERGQYSTPGGQSIVLHKNTIYAYVYGKLKIIDVSEPTEPKVFKTVEKYGVGHGEGGRDGKIWKTIRPVPDERLSDQEKVDIAVKLSFYPETVFEAGKMVEVMRDSIRVYELVNVGEETARFESDTFRKALPLEQMTGIYPRKALLSDGFLYVLTHAGFGAGVTVYDVSERGMVEKAGHYAAPEEEFVDMTMTEDGRLVVAGNSVHVVRPPVRD